MFEFARASLDVLTELLAAGNENQQAMVGSHVPGREGDLFALDADGTVLLLIREAYSEIGNGRFRKYDAISLMPTALYEVEVDGARFQRSYRALGLLPSHRHLVSAFAYMTASMLSVLPQHPAPQAVDEFLETLVDLLRSPSGVPESVMKGLWGELWVVAQSGRVREWTQAWHSRPASLYDFSFSNGYVEIKTHEGVRPRHHFSHEQLVDRSPQTVVASVLIFHDESGASLVDLIGEIASSLPLEERSKFLERCLRIMGPTVDSTGDFRFSVRNQESPPVVTVDLIPKVSIPGDEISDVTYTVDLTKALADGGFSYSEMFDSFPGSGRIDP